MSARDLITGDAKLTAELLLTHGTRPTPEEVGLNPVQAAVLVAAHPGEVEAFAALADSDDSPHELLDRLICATPDALRELGVYGLISDLWFRHPRGWSKWAT